MPHLLHTVPVLARPGSLPHLTLAATSTGEVRAAALSQAWHRWNKELKACLSAR